MRKVGGPGASFFVYTISLPFSFPFSSSAFNFFYFYFLLFFSICMKEIIENLNRVDDFYEINF